jgi:hypothetical protein
VIYPVLAERKYSVLARAFKWPPGGGGVGAPCLGLKIFFALIISPFHAMWVKIYKKNKKLVNVDPHCMER